MPGCKRTLPPPIEISSAGRGTGGCATVRQVERSPPASEPSEHLCDQDIDFYRLMWLADRETDSDVPFGTPPREQLPAQTTPCGCQFCNEEDNGFGELVCTNCGVVIRALVSGQDIEVRHARSWHDGASAMALARRVGRPAQSRRLNPPATLPSAMQLCSEVRTQHGQLQKTEKIDHPEENVFNLEL